MPGSVTPLTLSTFFMSTEFAYQVSGMFYITAFVCRMCHSFVMIVPYLQSRGHGFTLSPLYDDFTQDVNAGMFAAV